MLWWIEICYDERLAGVCGIIQKLGLWRIFGWDFTKVVLMWPWWLLFENTLGLHFFGFEILCLLKSRAVNFLSTSFNFRSKHFFFCSYGCHVFLIRKLKNIFTRENESNFICTYYIVLTWIFWKYIKICQILIEL